MSRLLRRSRRAPKRNSEYNVGDIVEIHRNGNALKGRLAQLLTEGPSANPRWLLKFDGQPNKDEEMYERSFGKLLVSVDDNESSGDTSPTPSEPVDSQRKGDAKTNGAANGRRSHGSKSGGSSSEAETGEESKGNKTETKNVKFHDDSNPGTDVESDTDGRNGKSSNRSAREERSRRRQAKIDEEIIPGWNESFFGAKRSAENFVDSNMNKRQRGDGDGEVIKVKLLTGTLYLYRGKQRRAEFIRRV